LSRIQIGHREQTAGLLRLDMPDARENKALLREAARVFMAAHGTED
jgi:hypothetical protein